ncbi:MAG TPA: chemotaxis response regulator protein-glutamate methylesterase [Pseudolabrys sp.]|nr:chemotaxis response regulator protein-glutamate methylesterase [Pseudolabrys sp.]
MTLAIPATVSAADRRVRVMIVDDAVVVRGLFSRWVEAEPDLEVVASLRTGREAVNQVERANPDVVVLDVDMPELDGIAALPLLLAKKPGLIVIMASTLTRRNAEISLKALSLGATDYIPKPSSNREVTSSSMFHRDLIEKIRGLGARALRGRLPEAPPRAAVAKAPQVLAPRVLPPKVAAPPLVPRAGTQMGVGAPTALRPMPLTPPRVLLIGASTGGPQALNALISQIVGIIDRSPVLITQHMPPTFTTILAEHLARIANRPAREASDGEEINAGTIYLAPGGKHMQVKRRDGTAVIEITDSPMINFCKPAVDPLFSSAATVWGKRVLALVLTGMGSDGLRGAQEIAAAGGTVLAQDEATSVVWGMPGQVANAGLCSAVLPLAEIAPKLNQLFLGPP